jgi:hypothetical protein
VRGEGGGQELLEQPPGGLAVRAHPALLHDHVALLVELAHHGLEEPLGLQVGPQLQAVGGEGIVVVGLVAAGAGVETDAALAVHDLAERVGDHVAVGLLDGLLPGLLQLRHLLLVRAYRPAPLRVVGDVGLLHLLQGGLLGGVVGGADDVRPLEGHVLEHVGQAGDAGHLAVGPHVDVDVEGEDRRFGPLQDDQGEAVVQDLDRHPLLEGSEVLTQGRANGPQAQGRSQQDAHGSTSHLTLQR